MCNDPRTTPDYMYMCNVRLHCDFEGHFGHGTYQTKTKDPHGYDMFTSAAPYKPLNKTSLNC